MRILFVCTGNICRSPTADGVARARIAALGLDWMIDSAGTGDWHAGERPDERATETAARRGYDLSPLRARAVDRSDFDRFDHLIAMDASHERFLRRLAPGRSGGQVSRLMDWVETPAERDVPDPYYGHDDGFERVLDQIEAGVDGLIARLSQPSG